MLDKISLAARPFAPLIGVAPLMRRAVGNQDLRPLAKALLARAEQHPLDANAYLDCSTLLQLSGERELALALQSQAIAIRPLYSVPASRASKGAMAALRLLVIMGPGDLMANTPIECLLEDSDVSLELLYVTLDSAWPDVVPDHDVLMIGVAESDANQPLLARLAGFVENWPRPVINRPAQIARLTRDGVCAALRGVAGLDMPVTARIDRGSLRTLGVDATALDAYLPNDAFPLIVRPIGSHAGHDLEKLQERADIAAYLARVEGEKFYLSRFVDYRNQDGLFRKYRIALIDGIPYVCHLAVSAHWMIHYLNAGMAESAEKRAEEADCMANFETDFAARHASALQAIHQRLGLAYLGIDCAETPTGELLVFEVDNAMVVHGMDAEHLYPYKKPAMQKVFDAFRAMLDAARQPALIN